MENDTVFIDAIEAGDQAQVEALLDSQPELLEVRVDDWMSPVLLALYYHQPDIAQMLWKRGAALDIFGAAAIGDIPRLEELLQMYPELAVAYAPDGFQPLAMAAYFGQHQAAASLLAHGAPVNSPSHNDLQATPLHSAAAGQHEEICRMLLSAGANPNLVQKDGFTPLHAAAQNGQVELVQLLQDYGADINARTADGATPQSLAESGGHEVAASMLEAYGNTPGGRSQAPDSQG